jgi:hypothetical protein
MSVTWFLSNVQKAIREGMAERAAGPKEPAAKSEPFKA